MKQSWAKYRDKLLPIIKQTEKRNNHIFANEIDSALSDERAFLFVGEDGFFVLKPESESGLVRVVVLFAFNWGESAIARYQDQIEKLSREIGARSIRIYTVVTGLISSLKEQGYNQADSGSEIMQWDKTL